MGLLADVFSYGDGLKRKLGGLLSDPMGTLDLGARRFDEDQQKLQAQAQDAGYLPGSRSVLQRPQDRAQAQQQFAANALDTYGGLLGATVWHGSPHKFDKFDSSKIGAGEGSQAYGHGLYVAESPTVANSYRAMANNPGRRQGGLTKEGADKVVLDSIIKMNAKQLAGGDVNKFAEIVKKHPGAFSKPEELVKRISEYEGNLAPSYIYKVDLPDEHIAKMLDWDKPLSQQAPEVQKMLEPLGYSSKAQVSQFDDDLLAALTGGAPKPLTQIRDPLGSDIARGGGLFDSKSQIEKSKRLRELGIPGIRYLDGGSRGAGGGTSNYVVFPGNEGLLSILERNGQALK